MQPSHFKSLNLALIFCLLPLGLKAQTVVNTAETSIRNLAANEVLNVEAPDGSIIVATGNAVTGHADGSNTITNAGEIRSDDDVAIVLQSLNTITNSGTITGANHGIDLQGTALAATVAAQATRPAYNASDTLRDAYYFNNTVVNETGGTITGAGTGSGINIAGARAQIRNTGGDIIASDTGNGINFNTGSGQGFVYNTGSITAASGNAISAASGVNAIVIHNDGGTIESTGNNAIVLQSLNLIVNSGEITGGSHGISLAGAADATMLANNPTAPAYDSNQTLRDAYYFNNKIINEVVGTNTGSITGKGTGSGINIGGARAQILNTGGDIFAEGTGHSIHFNTGSGQGFVYNTGSITAADGNAIAAVSGVDEITIHNTGTIESTAGNAIVLQSLNIIVNSGEITGGFYGINLEGTADDAMIIANPTAPAYDATETDRDAYYFNNKVINQTGGTITNAGTGRGIVISGTRAQILNTGGDITGEGSGAEGIYFYTGSGQGFVYNTGNITATLGNAIAVATGVNEIIIHNDGGTIEGALDSHAIALQSLNLVVNSGEITGGHGISLLGAADATMLANTPTAPAYDASDTLRDAYYFNNKVINEVVGTNTGTITGGGTGHGINITGARAQIFNTGGDIVAEDSGHAISFGTGAGQGFVYSTGNITAASGNAINAADGINEIIIHNDTDGTIESTDSHAIVLQSLNLLVNSGTITGEFDGIRLIGVADDAMIIANPTAPAWDAEEALRDAHYFNNKIVNEAGGTITSKGVDHGIHILGKRAQIFNHGDIIAEGSGHGIYFGPESGESLVVNTGTIRSANGWGIFAHNDAEGGIVIVNGGCIEGGAGAIRLSRGNDILVIRRGSGIIGTVDFDDGTDELIYAGADISSRLDSPANLEIIGESDSNSPLGVGDDDLCPKPMVDDSIDPSDPSDPLPSLSYKTLFSLSDELALDLNASVQDALYEHNFSLDSERIPSNDASFWTHGFGSFRKQDDSEDSAKANYTLGGILVGYDFVRDRDRNFGWFLGTALGTLDTDDSAELTTQSFFGGLNLEFAKNNFFYGLNLAAGFTYHDSERSVEESGETVKIKGEYKGYFFSPEFILGARVQNLNIIPSLRVRYLFASLEDYTEEGRASNRVSVEKRNTGTMESRAQVAFPLQSFDQAWSFEPRLGLQYRADLNKDSFDAETVETKAPIDYDAEKEKVLGVFGGLSVRYLKNDTAFKFNVDAISSDESLVLRAQAGFGFRF